jgi:hypothetical protein
MIVFFVFLFGIKALDVEKPYEAVNFVCCLFLLSVFATYSPAELMPACL